MEPQALSAVISFGAAVFGAFLGSVVGPILSARLARSGSREQFVRDQRREAYSQFAVEVEKAQRAADALAYGVRGDGFSPQRLDDLEYARVKIDLFGSHLAKVWAYRCFLALFAVEQGVSEEAVESEQAELRRAKVHEARANLVRVLRVELGVSGLEKDDQVSQQELRQTKVELQTNRERVISGKHHEWLETLPDDPTAIGASREAKAMYRRTARAAFQISQGRQALQTRDER